MTHWIIEDKVGMVIVPELEDDTNMPWHRQWRLVSLHHSKEEAETALAERILLGTLPHHTGGVVLGSASNFSSVGFISGQAAGRALDSMILKVMS